MVGIRGGGIGCPMRLRRRGAQGEIIRAPRIMQVLSCHRLWTPSHRREVHSRCRRKWNDQAS
eukprot:5225031-Pyramimonas_sp.AAC.1